MSKSAGNVVLLEDVVQKGFDPLALRLVFLENRYRSQMDLNWEQISAADSTLNRWRKKYQDWSSANLSIDTDEIDEKIESLFAFIRDDLDPPRALVELRSIERDQATSPTGKARIFEALDALLGLDLTRAPHDIELNPEIYELIEKRRIARAKRDFATSDLLRDQLSSLGIAIKDGPDGMNWEVIP
jgi:cysteinyl-tRNA synthetase